VHPELCPLHFHIKMDHRAIRAEMVRNEIALHESGRN